VHENVGDQRLAVRVDWLGSDVKCGARRVRSVGSRESPSNVRRKRSSQSGKSEANTGPDSYR